MAWRAFRVENITAVVKAVSDRVRREHPKTAISAAVFQNPESTPDTLAQDWFSWCKRGYLDFNVLRELGAPGFTVLNFDKRAQGTLPEILTATFVGR